MKIIAVVLVILIVLGGVFMFFKNQICASLVSAGFEKFTGAPMQIGRMNVSLRNSAVEALQVRIYNTGNFPGSDRLMAEIPRFYFAFDLGEFLKGKLHIRSFVFDLDTLVLVRNSGGAVNVDALKALQPKGGGKPPAVAIDQAELSVHKIIYKDYQLGSPMVKEFYANVHEKYSDITDPDVLVSGIVARALKTAGLAGITGALENKAGKALEKFKGKLGGFLPGQ